MNNGPKNFKEKARQQVFKSSLRDFPVIFEFYLRSFNIDADRDKAMGEILSIISTSENVDVAYSLMCHYLDNLEENS